MTFFSFSSDNASIGSFGQVEFGEPSCGMLLNILLAVPYANRIISLFFSASTDDFLAQLAKDEESINKMNLVG